MAQARHIAAEGELPWAHRLDEALLVDRVGMLVELSQGVRVAHVGFADAGCELSHRIGEDWLHADLAQSASYIVGLDISQAAVQAAHRDGYEAFGVDCTDRAAVAALNLPPFDLVVAGEIIEHLESPGPFLEAMHELIGRSGRLVLTTPNAYRPQNALLALGRREWIHPDHVLTFSPRTLTVLLERSGWRVVKFMTYLQSPRPSSMPLSAGLALMRILTRAQRLAARRISPYVADGLIVIAEQSDDHVPASSGH